MSDHGLDLAVIGDGCTAALREPKGRLAWWPYGRRQQARDSFEVALRHRNHYGLLSEDIHPQTGALWGHFPQTYLIAGLIWTAMRLSRSWEDRYWRG